MYLVANNECRGEVTIGKQEQPMILIQMSGTMISGETFQNKYHYKTLHVPLRANSMVTKGRLWCKDIFEWLSCHAGHPKRSCITPEMVIYNIYSFTKCKQNYPLWLWNQQERSPEVQNKGISGPTKRTYPPKLKKILLVIEILRCLQVVIKQIQNIFQNFKNLVSNWDFEVSSSWDTNIFYCCYCRNCSVSGTASIKSWSSYQIATEQMSEQIVFVVLNEV